MTENKKEMWCTPECEEIMINDKTMLTGGSGADGSSLEQS